MSNLTPDSVEYSEVHSGIVRFLMLLDAMQLVASML